MYQTAEDISVVIVKYDFKTGLTALPRQKVDWRSSVLSGAWRRLAIR